MKMQYATLCAGDIATPPPAMNRLQTLEALQYYYQMTYGISVVPGTVTLQGAQVAPMVALNPGGGGGTTLYPSSFSLPLAQKVSTPTMTFYSPVTGTAANVAGYVYSGASSAGGTGDLAITHWAQTASPTGDYLLGAGDATLHVAGNSVPYWGEITYHYTADARLGTF